jgi:hypothetical protein
MGLDVRSCECGYPLEVVVDGEIVKYYTLSGNEMLTCLCCGQDFRELHNNGKLENATEFENMLIKFRKLSPNQKVYIDYAIAKIVYDVLTYKSINNSNIPKTALSSNLSSF